MGHIPIHEPRLHALLYCTMSDPRGCHVGNILLIAKDRIYCYAGSPSISHRWSFPKTTNAGFFMTRTKRKIQYDKVGQVKASSSRMVLQFSKQTPQAKDELLSIVTNLKVQAFVSSP